MSNSPVLTPCQSQTEIQTDSPDIQTLTPIDNTSISEKTDLSISLKVDDRTSSMSCHVDENNENEAVCKRFNLNENIFLINNKLLR